MARLREAREYLMKGTFMGLPDKTTVTGLSITIQMRIQMGDHRGALYFINMALNMNLTKVLEHTIKLLMSSMLCTTSGNDVAWIRSAICSGTHLPK